MLQKILVRNIGQWTSQTLKPTASFQLQCAFVRCKEILQWLYFKGPEVGMKTELLIYWWFNFVNYPTQKGPRPRLIWETRRKISNYNKLSQRFSLSLYTSVQSADEMRIIFHLSKSEAISLPLLIIQGTQRGLPFNDKLFIDVFTFLSCLKTQRTEFRRRFLENKNKEKTRNEGRFLAICFFFQVTTRLLFAEWPFLRFKGRALF